MATIAYIRVSSVDQNTTRQFADSDIQFDKVFTDKASGKDTNRQALQDCFDYIREGDTLWVYSIDRLARSLQDLQAIVDKLTSRGVTIKFFKEVLTFTSGSSDPISKLLFQILGSFAEFERNIIRERQREGIAKAKEAGKYSHGKGGRQKSLDREAIINMRNCGMSLRKVADSVGCSLSSVQRVLGE